MANLALRCSVNSFVECVKFSYEVRFSLLSVEVVTTTTNLQGHDFHVMEAVTWEVKVVSCSLASVLCSYVSYVF